MADGTIFDQTQDAVLTAATRLLTQKTSAATASQSATFALLGGLVPQSTIITDANVAGVVGEITVWNTSGHTANRDWTLPTTAQVGECCALYIHTGDADYETLIKTTAASSDTINGVVVDTTEHTRMFITGEYMVFQCIVADTGWIVIQDGRIPCVGVMADRSATASHYTNATAVTPAYDTSVSDVGDIVDTTNNRINIRRDGTYISSFHFLTPEAFDDGEVLDTNIYLNTTRISVNRRTACASPVRLAESMSVVSEASGGDYFYGSLTQTTGADVTWSSAADQAPTITVTEVL